MFKVKTEVLVIWSMWVISDYGLGYGLALVSKVKIKGI